MRRIDGRGRSVAFYSPGWPPGQVQNGIVTYVGSVASGLRDLGLNTHVVAGFTAGTERDPAVVDLSALRTPRARTALMMALTRLPATSTSALSFGWAVAQGLGALSPQGFDLVEMEETFGGAWHTQRVSPVPVVVRLHGPWFLNGTALGVPVDEAFRLRDLAERRCITAAVGLTAPSRDVLERVRHRYGVALPHAAVIPNPTPVMPPDKRWSLQGCDKKSILFVGRFDRHKGGDLVIESFRRVAAAVPAAELIFVGPDRGFSDEDGKTYDLPTFLAARLPAELQTRVRVMGPMSGERIDLLRRQAFVTVVASRYENFPLALAEALSYGCPTVAARAGGIPEVLLDGDTGVLFAPGDAGDLAAKIISLFQASNQAAEFGRKASMDTALRFAPPAVARATLDYYETIWTTAPKVRPKRSWRGLYRLTSLG